MQVCLIYGQVFKSHSRGRCRAPLPRPGTSFSPALMAPGSDPCAKFQEFLSTLRGPKVRWESQKYPKRILKFDALSRQQHLRYQQSFHRSTSGVCLHYTHQVWSKSGKACLIYGPSFRTPFQGALSSPPATPGYQLQPGPDGRGFWPVCKVSRVFEHVKNPKSARKHKKAWKSLKKGILMFDALPWQQYQRYQ